MKSIISGALAVIGVYLLLLLFSVGALFAASGMANSKGSDQIDKRFSWVYQNRTSNPEAKQEWESIVGKRNAAADKAAYDDKEFGDYSTRAKEKLEGRLNINLTIDGMDKFEQAILLSQLMQEKSLPKAKERITVSLFGDNVNEKTFGKYNRAFSLKADKFNLADVRLNIRDRITSSLAKEADGRTYFSYSFARIELRKDGSTVTPKFRMTDSAELAAYQAFLEANAKAEANGFEDFSSLESIQRGNKIDITVRYRDIPVAISSTSQKVAVVTSDDRHMYLKSADELKGHEVREAKFIAVGGVEQLKRIIEVSNKKDLSALDLFEPSKKACPI